MAESNTYVTDIPTAAVSTVCPPPPEYMSLDELMKVFESGVASERLSPDPATGRVPVANIMAHVATLEKSGVIATRPTKRVGFDEEADMDKLVQQDAMMFEKLKNEYCFYEMRYRWALKDFLKKATSRIGADTAAAAAMLANTKVLNLRVNSVLEVMNFLAQRRVPEANMNKSAINNFNKSINQKMERLNKAYAFLNRENAIVLTQRESVRYTQEKNNYTSNQIAVWAALNIVALGTLFYVYRN